MVLIAGLLAVPAMGGVPDIPQEDPRSLAWDSGGDIAVAWDGEVAYLVEHGPNCSDTGTNSNQVCAWGPVTLDVMTDESPLRSSPDAPLIGALDIADVPGGRLVASFRDGTVEAAVVSDTVAVVVHLPVGSGAPTGYSNAAPCVGSSVFDLADDLLWFDCGPVALRYTNGGLTLYADDFEAVVAQPGGGVVGLIGGAEPTVGLFDLVSGDIFKPPELPAGSTVLGGAADAIRGVAVYLQTPCVAPCEQIPQEPADVFVDPIDLFDFWVAWVGWDGTIEDGFGVVPVGTGPSSDPLSSDRGTVSTDGEVVAISHPVRIIDALAPDAAASVWRLVDADGSLRDPFDAYGNATVDLDPAWSGLVHLGFIDGLAELTFWHLSDQGRFFDDAGQFEADIEALADSGVTLGCNAGGTLFCPEDPVTRGQMASFIARWRGLPLDAADRFSDDDGSTHEAAINAVAQAGITLGCDAADPTLFCPDQLVTRGQMASFLARALALADDFSDRFTDDDGSTHERAIDAIATAGITLGCDAGQPELFCPEDPVLRQQMAAFLVRAGL